MLNKNKLKQDLLQLATDMRKETEINDEKWATKMSDIIEMYVKSGDIIINGITTSGTPLAHTQTIPITIKIS